MTNELIEVLGVNPEHIARRADFYEHYAATLADVATDERSAGVAADTAGWRTAACVATALRFAAQYALLVDSQRAIRLLREAAERYLDLGVHYGYLLLATAEPDAVAKRMFSERGQSSSYDAQTHERPLAAAASAHPAQLTYLLLVMSGDRTIANELRKTRETLHERLRAHSTAPVGPQSFPVDFYLTFCDTLASVNDRGERITKGDSPSSRIVRTLGQMGQRYEDGIQRAHVNRYLWEEQQAPVDIVDLDIVGMTTIANAAMEHAGMDLKRDIRRAVDDRQTLAMLPIYVGLQLHEHGSGERPDSDVPPQQSQ
jgi:hypothetical protein